MAKHAAETPNRWITSPAARRYVYRVLEAALGVASSYGGVTAALSEQWLILAAAVLGLGAATALELAAQNVPED